MIKVSQHILDKIRKAKKFRATSLNLSNLQLAKIPDSVFELNNVREIDLSKNKLTELPKEILGLKKLLEINLSNNNFEKFPENLIKLNDLEILYLSSNQLKEIPSSIIQLINLKKIYLSSNHFEELPESLTLLASLQELYLSNNQISDVPKSIVNLINLKVLHLSNNSIGKFPDKITELDGLEILYLSSNSIREIPYSITNLQRLKELRLNSNFLTEFPIFITRLKKIAIISLRKNKLKSIPTEIDLLTELIKLDLNGNLLEELPENISNLFNLRALDLGNNPINYPPYEVVQRGIKSIKEYFATQKKDGTSRLFEAKILVVGAGGAGKTSLSKKILNANYELVPENKDISTEGIDILKYQFKRKEGNEFQINLWDFGGQEIYHSTHQFFLTKRSLYLLVTDSRKEDTDLNYWLNVQQLLASDSPIFIIQNEKQDRVKELKKNEIRERFSNVKEFFKTNLKDNRGLEAIVKRIESEVQHLPHIGNDLPKSWVAIRGELEGKADNYISQDEYLTICGKYGLDKPNQALVLSDYLHDIGVMLHFQEDPILERLVILKNEWGTDAVYKVIDYPQVKANQGRFTYADLKDIWQEQQYAGKHLELITLMEKFKLCYKIPDTNNYITPARLPVEKPTYRWNEKDNTQFRYRYKFMPKGILTRFIVEMHRYIKGQELVWNTGVVLENENTKAEVLEVYGENEIKIRIKGLHPERLRPLIMERIDRINTTFTNLQVEKLIPCNCETCLVDTVPPTFYREEELLERKAHNKQEKECSKAPYKNGDVFKMLNDYSVGIELNQVLIQDARKVLSKGVIGDVFDILEGVNFYKSKFRQNNILELKARYNSLRRQSMEGIIQREQYVLEENQLRKNLINYLEDLEKYSHFATSNQREDYGGEIEEVYLSDKSVISTVTPNTVVNVNINEPPINEKNEKIINTIPSGTTKKILDALAVILALTTLYFCYQWVEADTANWEPLVASSSLVLTLVMGYAAWRSRK